MIIKETSLAKIQLLDEREPDAARLGLTMQVRLALVLTENGIKVGELQDYPMRVNPDLLLVDCCREVATQLAVGGFPAVPRAIQDRLEALKRVYEAPLGKAQWRVTSTREIIRRLRAQASTAEIINAITLAQTQLTQAETALALLRAPCPAETHKETRLSLMTVLPDGSIELRLRKCVCEGGRLVSLPQYHRVVLHPGLNHTATLAMINGQLPKLNDEFGSCPPLPQLDIDRIAAVCASEHTLDRVTTWRLSQIRPSGGSPR